MNLWETHGKSFFNELKLLTYDPHLQTSPSITGHQVVTQLE